MLIDLVWLDRSAKHSLWIGQGLQGTQKIRIIKIKTIHLVGKLTKDFIPSYEHRRIFFAFHD